MSLKDQLSEDLKDAIRAGDDVRKTTLRAVIAEIKKAEVPQVVEHRIGAGDSWRSVPLNTARTPHSLPLPTVAP